MRIQAVTRFYNKALREKRKLLGLTQAEVARESQVGLAFFNDVENMRQLCGDFTEVCNKLTGIAVALDCDFEALFPDDYLKAVSAQLLPRAAAGAVVWEQDVCFDLLSERRPECQLPDVAELYLERPDDMQEAVRKIVAELPEVLGRVLSLRYGLEDGKARTLSEIAETLGVTLGRIRQRESRAFRKLRSSSSSVMMRDYLD